MFPIVATGCAALFSFNLLGAGFSQSGALQPMVFKLGVPIGSIVFWLRRPGRAEDREPPR